MVEGATARVWPRVLCPPTLCVPHLQAPFSSVGINSCAGAAGERGFGLGVFLCRARGTAARRLRRGEAHTVRGSWEWYLAGTEVPKPPI